MIEQGMSEGDEINKSPVHLPSYHFSYHPYPPPTATYNDIVGSRELFMNTLKKLHAAMGTKFMIPIVGGKNLDLHRLFVDVTSRGGITKVVKERKWKEVTAGFNFPSSATNASFILRKYYISLLYHYEQIHFFNAKCWAPWTADELQNLPAVAAPHPRVLSPALQQTQGAAENTPTPKPEVPLAPLSAGSPACGVIDGKFESGYLVTVKVGSEELKGVLYQVPDTEDQVEDGSPPGWPQTQAAFPQSVKPRRKRRKKSEIRKRDPAHPKPNRSGYNFFFAEQHAMLKPLYQGRDREISRTIGESWKKLQESDRAVYQEQALKDKERYRLEMEGYRERLRTGQLVRSGEPNQPEPPPFLKVNLADLNSTIQPKGHEITSDKSNETEEEEGEGPDKNSDFGDDDEVDSHLKTVNVEVMADEEAFYLQTTRDRAGPDDRNPTSVMNNENRMLVSAWNDTVPGVEENQQLPHDADESVSSKPLSLCSTGQQA